MCRWFAYISPDEECLLEDVLVTPTHSLAKQVNSHFLPKLISHHPDHTAKAANNSSTHPLGSVPNATTKSEVSLRNRLLNADGFGVAFYGTARSSFLTDSSGPRPTLYKSANPPTNDANFQSICANTSSKTIFAHIRAATGATSVVAINNHPFAFGRHCIMHNGVVNNISAIRRDLLDLLDTDVYENIHGTTDSEHLAALYMTYLTGGSGKSSWEKTYSLQEMKAALTKTFHAIIQLQKKYAGPQGFEASSLNVACTDGDQMIAFRFRNHDIEQPPSLYWSSTAGVTLNRKYPDHADGAGNDNARKQEHEHGKHVIVGSEPTTYKVGQWNLIEKNHAILVNSNGEHISEEIDLPAEFISSVQSEHPGHEG